MSDQVVSTSRTLSWLSTDELAAGLAMSPKSIRKRYCQTGAYFGLRPVKMPNRRLMWPGDSLEQLAKGTITQKGAA